MQPIFLNPPWSHRERLLAARRRRETARRFIHFLLWSAAWLALGVGLGAVLFN